MKQITFKQLTNILLNNGYTLKRINGSHHIFYNDEQKHITVPKDLKSVIALRIIKQNKLNAN